MLKVKIQKLLSDANIPLRMTEHAAGYDLTACLNHDILIKSGEVALVRTGIAVSLPVGFEAQIRPRSGLAIKHQIGVLNSPGTIDADYRGEIKVILFNFGKNDFVVRSHSRIAQMVITQHETIDFIVTEQLDSTERGSGGFGHTNQ
ncbi:MAG: dUTP diphosphatase [Candidatus Cloacimonetes bacterium]|nr:dUTP diphosphatase [Candidatus Cloacimonadota bacterium]